jgi:hypothetical protein
MEDVKMGLTEVRCEGMVEDGIQREFLVNAILLSSIKCGEFRDQVSNSLLLKRDPSPRNE